MDEIKIARAHTHTLFPPAKWDVGEESKEMVVLRTCLSLADTKTRLVSRKLMQ